MRVSIINALPSLLAALSVVLPPASLLAQDGDRTLAEQSVDPVSTLMQVAIFSDVDIGVGEREENDLILTVQPQLPLRLVRDWNVVVWSVFRLHSRPPPTPEEDRMNGLGDSVVRLLLSPVGAGPWRWGVGPVAFVPTATRRGLGTTAFGLGGAATARYQGGPWTLGALGQHFASVHEAVGGTAVQSSLIRPFAIFTTPSGVTLGLDSETRVNWEAPRGERWQVPIQATVGQVALIGNQQVNLQLGGRYYVDSIAGGPDWGLRLLVTLLFPVEPGPPEAK